VRCSESGIPEKRYQHTGKVQRTGIGTIENAKSGTGAVGKIPFPEMVNNPIGSSVTLQGVSGTLAFGSALSASVYKISDEKGNWAIIASPALGAGIAASVGYNEIVFPKMGDIFEYDKQGGTTTAAIGIWRVGVGKSETVVGNNIGEGRTVSVGYPRIYAELTVTVPIATWWIYTHDVR